MKVATRMRQMILAGGVAFLAAREVFGQGCVMCYTSAAAQNPRAIQALNHAILVLLVPPLAIFAGIFSFIYRRRNISRNSRI